MQFPNDDNDEELLHMMMLAACIEEDEKVPYAERRVPELTGIQWVQSRMKDPKRFYSCFRMRRSVFTMLHDILVADYGLQSTSQMSSIESVALFCGWWVHLNPIVKLQIILSEVLLQSATNFTMY